MWMICQNHFRCCIHLFYFRSELCPHILFSTFSVFLYSLSTGNCHIFIAIFTVWFMKPVVHVPSFLFQCVVAIFSQPLDILPWRICSPPIAVWFLIDVISCCVSCDVFFCIDFVWSLLLVVRCLPCPSRDVDFL